MRPVERGGSPVLGDFDEYNDAFLPLQGRLGPFCSYCERRIPTNFAVEHIQPKSIYPLLEKRWDNFLLACVNCNSTKGQKDLPPDQTYTPDRDNTFVAFEYLPNGVVQPASGITPLQKIIARTTLELTGLQKKSRYTYDENGRLIAWDRASQRMETWLVALESLKELEACRTPQMQSCLVKLALASGFFSIWMKVFEGEPDMRQLFIDGFTGTAGNCFDAATHPISPRPANPALAHSGKI